ncbi:hypothetical protein K3495_g7835 [Podosphaera aphanis]|nr:hypothetical protein K3495_g7835 [Podosphaera aphanis]
MEGTSALSASPVTVDLPSPKEINASTPQALGISTDEIALYDRQIRLWGVQAQEKIRNAKILLINMKALANEIAKNLVLTGIYSLTIIDHETVTEDDLGAQFFISEADFDKNRAEAAALQIRRLNPRVHVIVDQSKIQDKPTEYFGAFDIIIATDLQPTSLEIINTATRQNHKPFYATGVNGFYGYIFSDLIQHEYILEREKSNRRTAVGHETRTRSVVDVKEKNVDGKILELVTKRENYSPWNEASDKASLPTDILQRRNRLKAVTPILSCLRALWDFSRLHDGKFPSTNDDLKLFTTFATQRHKALGLPDETLRSEVVRKFLQNLGCEIAPVTAVLGGQLAQDVINVLGARQPPIQNMVIFDGDTMEAPMYTLHTDEASASFPNSFEVQINRLPKENGKAANGDINTSSEVIEL